MLRTVAMEKDAMFGKVMESLMAEKMAELEAAIAAAEEEARIKAEEEAAAAIAAAEAAAAAAKLKAEEEAREAAAKAEAEAAAAKAKAEAEAAEKAAAEAKAANDAAAAAAAAKAAEEAAAAIAAAEAARKQAEEEAAAASAAAQAKADAEAAAARKANLKISVEPAANTVTVDPVERTLIFASTPDGLAELEVGRAFALSGLGDADGVYTVAANDGSATLTLEEELPTISADPKHVWIPGTDAATVTEGPAVLIQAGQAAVSAAKRKASKKVRKDLLPPYQRLPEQRREVVVMMKEAPEFKTLMVRAL